MIHFEELWEKCERFHKEDSPNETSTEILEKLLLKIELYKAINSHSFAEVQDRQKAKSRLYGEILLSLTQLSFIEDINVFEALQISLHETKAGF